MRVKKAKKSPRSIRYLLSADQRLQRISLKKISERLKKAKRSPRAKTSVGAGHTKRESWAISSRAIVLGTACLVGAAALIVAGQPSPRTDVARVGAPLDAYAPLENELTEARLETKRTASSQAAATATSANSDTAGVSTQMMSVGLVGVPVVKSTAKQPAAEPASPQSVAVDSVAQADNQNAAPVTITGCLEHDDEMFWLKDTAGVDAPKSRSWRSGFLKKRASRIALVDTAKTLKLPGYVGDRVAATGILMNREMRARSLRRVGESCN